MEESTAAADKDSNEHQQHGQHHPNTTKKEQPKNNNKKRETQPRYAFRTKSDVDLLDDGYRWRKYGQKAVKNSPFPRSYYRCTSTSCGVKKRIERSSEDPSIVVTVYEGTHTHPSPITPPPPFQFIPETTPAIGLSAYQDLRQQLTFHQQPYFQDAPPPLTPNITHPHLFQETPYCPPPPPSSITTTTTWSSSSSTDRGLLQDMLPSHMLKGYKE